MLNTTEAYDMEMEALLERLRQRQNGHKPEFMPAEPPRGKVAIVGLSGCGKKALYNSLWKWQVLKQDTPRQGIHNLGAFSLVSLPSVPHNADEYLMQLNGFDLVVYVLDIAAGLRSEDFQWLARLRANHPPLLVVVNKVNLIHESHLPAALADIQQKLNLKVLPLDATDQNAVHQQFLPMMLKLCPQIGAVLAREIPSLRQHVASHFIRQAVMSSHQLIPQAGASDTVNALLELQTSLVQRVAEVYGYQSQQELALIKFCASLSHQFIQQFHQNMSVPAWLTSNLVASFSTWIVGQMALLYYGSEGRFWK